MNFADIKYELKKQKCPEKLMTDEAIFTEHFFNKAQEALGMELYDEGYTISDMLIIDNDTIAWNYMIFTELLENAFKMKLALAEMTKYFQTLDNNFVIYEMNNRLELRLNLLSTKHDVTVRQIAKTFDDQVGCNRTPGFQRVKSSGHNVYVFSATRACVKNPQARHKIDINNLERLKIEFNDKVCCFMSSCSSYRDVLERYGLTKSKFARILDAMTSSMDSFYIQADSWILKKEVEEDFVFYKEELLIIDVDGKKVSNKTGDKL